MKPVFVLALSVVLLVSCQPKKPWSPYDKESGTGTSIAKPAQGVSSTERAAAAGTDIGDLEQAIFVNAGLASEMNLPQVRCDSVLDRNKHATKIEVTIAPPYPDSLWVEYQVKSSRAFDDAPGVVRARIFVNDKEAGKISAVVGAEGFKSSVSAKVDLFKPFEGNVPETFLAKLDGDLYLMPTGTDEKSVDPETATSNMHSKAMYATLIRVARLKPDAPELDAGPAAPAASSAPPAAPAPTAAAPTTPAP